MAKNSIQKRGLHDPDDYWNKDYDCGDGLVRGWTYAARPPIQEGVAYLRRQHGPTPLGAYGCGRVSCSYNSAIFMCNRVS